MGDYVDVEAGDDDTDNIQQWSIIGVWLVCGVHRWSLPMAISPDHIQIMNGMRAMNRKGVLYDSPCYVVMEKAALFEIPIPVDLTDISKKTISRRLAQLLRAGRKIVRNDSTIPLDVPPPRDSDWRVIRHVVGTGRAKESVPPYLINKMREGDQFAYPMWPHVLSRIGLSIPQQKYNFNFPNFVQDDDEVTSQDECDEAATDDLQDATYEFEPAEMLAFLKLHSMVKPAVELKEVLEIVAVILGTPAEVIRNVKVPSSRITDRALTKLDMLSMQWSHFAFSSGYKLVCSLKADSSVQGGHDYLNQVMDVVGIPPGLDVVDVNRLDYQAHFSRVIVPLTTTRHGEKDFSHKFKAHVHAMKCMTGTDDNLRALRYSNRGFCPDQGIERMFADGPNILNMENTSDMLDKYRQGQLKLLASDLDAYLWPLAILSTGPIHQIWNSFEAQILAAPSWPIYKPVLSALLNICGHLPSRQRFMQICCTNSTPAERRMYHTWVHKVIDFKWEYMEGAFRKVSNAIAHFFDVFDYDKLRTPVGHVEGESRQTPLLAWPQS